MLIERVSEEELEEINGGVEFENTIKGAIIGMTLGAANGALGAIFGQMRLKDVGVLAAGFAIFGGILGLGTDLVDKITGADDRHKDKRIISN